jgi:hypothetical protein
MNFPKSASSKAKSHSLEWLFFILKWEKLFLNQFYCFTVLPVIILYQEYTRC